MALLSYLLALLVFVLLTLAPMSKYGSWRPPRRSPAPPGHEHHQAIPPAPCPRCNQHRPEAHARSPPP